MIIYCKKIEGTRPGWVIIKLECSLAKNIKNCKLSTTVVFKRQKEE